MEGHGATVLGVYATAGQAEEAVDHLIAEQFASGDISVLLRNPSPSQESSSQKTGRVAGPLGGTLGLLDALGTLTVPGSGPLIGAGPIMSHLVGSRGTSMARSLAAMGIQESRAKNYERKVGEGWVLVSVHCAAGSATRAAELLKQTGAQEVSAESAASGNREATASPSSRA